MDIPLNLVGGIQEECPSYGVLVPVMLDMTERPEGVDAGTLKLDGSNEETIYKTFKLLLENKDEYNKMSRGGDRAAPGNVRTLHPGYALPRMR